MKRAEKYHIIKKLKNSDSLCFQWVSEFLFSPTVKDGIILPESLFFYKLMEIQPHLSGILTKAEKIRCTATADFPLFTLLLFT